MIKSKKGKSMPWIFRGALAGLVTSVFLGCGKAEMHIKSVGETGISSAVIYPKIRIWSSPSKGEAPSFNSPSFQWPSRKGAIYSIRISSSKNFDKNLIENDGIAFAIFNPHKILNEGIWYWQYKVNNEEWNEIDSFTITTSTPKFTTSNIKTILARIPSTHPRLLAKKTDLEELRQRAKHYKESEIIVIEADRHLIQPPPKEESALPAYTGKDDFENEKIASLASKWVGWRVYEVLNLFSQAYILTADEKYFISAKKWMLEISKWDPRGPTHTNNFGDAGIMAGLALGADTFWDLLSETERKEIINQASARADQFYKIYINQVESRSSSMHVWQHILHRMLYTSLAFAGEIPKANLWLEYIYELWIAQSPKMGEMDGAWFNGTGYFDMNTISLYEISDVFSELSGVDFMSNPWYKNNPKWLLYAFPPGSVSDGFCNDGDKYAFPNINYAAYADAAARRLKDPFAALYAQKCEEAVGLPISADKEWAWYRIIKGYKEGLPKLDPDFIVPQAEVFPDVGVAYMHTALPKTENNLMFSIRSSPFGPMGHAHAEQNGFNIAYGGKRLFYNTGYRPSMGDPHFLDWHKHTRGHNSILIDGNGQPFNAGAYGWLPRFVHGKQISYAVGDASNAYSGNDENKNLDFGMTLFKRHYIMIRPSTIVIYDELEADHPAEWSWLIHNDTGIKIDGESNRLIVENELANAQVNLYSSLPIHYQVSDKFSVPVENWTNKMDKKGDTILFHKQWHFSGVSKEKTNKMRYLAIIQVKPKIGPSVCEKVVFDESTNTYSLGGWNIKAEMDICKGANIKISDNLGTASFVSSGVLDYGGKIYKGSVTGSSKLVEVIDDEKVFQEALDQIPDAMKGAMLRGTEN